MRTRRKTVIYEVAEGILGKRGFKVLRVLTYRRSPIRGGWMTTRVKTRVVGRAPVKRHQALVLGDVDLYGGYY